MAQSVTEFIFPTVSVSEVSPAPADESGREQIMIFSVALWLALKSAGPTDENSPPIYRWEGKRLMDCSPRSGQLIPTGRRANILFSRPPRGLPNITLTHPALKRWAIFTSSASRTELETYL